MGGDTVWGCGRVARMRSYLLAIAFRVGGETVDMWELLSKEKLGEIDVLVV